MKSLLKLTVFACLGLYSSFLLAQSSDIKEVTNNEDLKYSLTYIKNPDIIKNTKNAYFLKGYQMPSTEYISYSQGDETKSFFYFLVSSFDEVSHQEARLYKTIGYNNPTIEQVTYEKGHYLVTLKYFDDKGKSTTSKVEVAL